REDLYHRLNVIPIFVPPLRERREDIPLLVRAFGEEFASEMNRKPVRFDDKAMKLLTSLPFTGNIRELRNVIERIVILVPGDTVRMEDVERLGLAFSMGEQASPPMRASAPLAATVSLPDGAEPAWSAPRIADDGSAALSREENSDDLGRSVILTPADRRRMEEPSSQAGTPAPRGFSLLGANEHPLDVAMQATTFQEFKDRAEKAFIEEKLRENNWNISRTAESLDIQRSHLYTKMRKYGLMKDARVAEAALTEPIEPDIENLLEDEDEVL
ncbi:MAG TPA: helix-turn-helix domain-containing protein, partial [Candidatus Kapabacteria bacterium]|nr:helix-turn-helix domain-containing protein [Candidatus Kapabacteria bacterium]